MITREMIKSGVKKNVVQFVLDPVGHGTVCKIGDHWFFFGGVTAENEDPDVYLKNSDMNENVRMVHNVLEGFKEAEGFKNEYAYYEAVLTKNLAAVNRQRGLS